MHYRTWGLVWKWINYLGAGIPSNPWLLCASTRALLAGNPSFCAWPHPHLSGFALPGWSRSFLLSVKISFKEAAQKFPFPWSLAGTLLRVSVPVTWLAWHGMGWDMTKGSSISFSPKVSDGIATGTWHIEDSRAHFLSSFLVVIIGLVKPYLWPLEVQDPGGTCSVFAFKVTAQNMKLVRRTSEVSCWN